MIKEIERVNFKKSLRRRKKYERRFKLRHFFLIVAAFFMISFFISNVISGLSPKIAVIPIYGVILTQEGHSFSSSVSSRFISETLYALADDSTTKAIVLDINSPGGSPVASEEISKAVEFAKTKKKVVSFISDAGTSGAFWVAVSSNETYASSMSVLGGIGVTSAGISFENFILEHNITYRKLTAGKYKDMGSIFREITEEEEEIIQSILDEIYENFISHVMTSRGLSEEVVREYATGEIFLGDEAVKAGFIDNISDYQTLVEELKEQTKTSRVVIYAPPRTFAQELGLTSLITLNPFREIVSL